MIKQMKREKEIKVLSDNLAQISGKIMKKKHEKDLDVNA